MNAFSPAPSILEASGCDTGRVSALLEGALSGADDGELFLERSESEMLVFDDGRLKSANYDATEGFGLRVVAGETAGYAHSSEISEDAIKRAAASAALAKRGYAGVAAEGPRGTNTKLYGEDDPLASPEFGGKVALLQEIDAFARARDPRVVQVSASIAGERRVVEILRADGKLLRDVRPLVRVNVSVTVEKDGRRENGSSGAGGRASFEAWIRPGHWQDQVDEALRQALVNLDAVACPAGGDGRGARPRLERRSAARGGRARVGGRFQPQGHLRLLRPHRRAGGGQGRDGDRRRLAGGPARLAHHRRRRARRPNARC